ncbi:MAG: histidine phosphatase family protein [Bacilli bacterium]|nr:histidine phosphatase family protein [bacterium]MDY2696751.1 histidine phosphatase family protein [Bacilli bacterium]
MTKIYLLRHSQPFRKLLGEYNSSDVEQVRNEKNVLSVYGEKLAREISERKELQNIDVIYSSHYVRAMCTAKYIAENNNIKLNVDERLGERKFGVNDISELPSDFFEEQFRNWDYKLEKGESANEVSKRMNEVLLEIINNNKDKTIAIVSHGTAISAMLKTWCNVLLNEETKLIELYFNDKLVFDGNWNCPELFELEFDNNNLISISNIR